MKLTDILKTATVTLLTVILLSCGGGGGGNDEPVIGISGHVTIGEADFAGVTVTLSGAASATTPTNSSGYYFFPGLANGDYVVTPSRTGCTFTPTNATVTFAGTNITQNFTATVTPAIAAGGNHSLALKSDGTVWAWGINASGQLGDGTITTRYTPVQVSGLTGIIAIAAGESHSLALKSNGTVWAWGLNTSGQLGDGTITSRYTPVQVSTLSGIAAITAGGYHSLALTTGGAVYAWGLNNNGQLGDGTITARRTPVSTNTLSSGIAVIAAGRYHSLALTSGGAVYAWGYNSNGQLGNGTIIDEHSPVSITALSSGIDAIAAGGYHSLALTSGGAVYAWGLNGNGQLGDGTTTERRAPVSISSLASGIDAIAAGGYHSLALTSSGAVYAWGLNSSGQLGDTTFTDRHAPVSTGTLSSGVNAIAAGGYHSLALTDIPTVKAWGYNGYGQLGNNSITNSSTPVDVDSF